MGLRAIAQPAERLKSCFADVPAVSAGDPIMIYVLAALVPPLGLLLNAHLFSAILSVFLIVLCLFLGLFFHPLLLVPPAHGVTATNKNRKQRMQREVGEPTPHPAPPP